MKYFAFVLSLFLFLTTYAFSKTINKNDLIYGKNNVTPQSALAVWDTELKQLLTDHKVNSNNISKVKQHIENVAVKIRNKELTKAYCEFGYIGDNLYFIIKSQKKSQTNYNYSNILLAKRSKSKSIKSEEDDKSENINNTAGSSKKEKSKKNDPVVKNERVKKTKQTPVTSKPKRADDPAKRKKNTKTTKTTRTQIVKKTAITSKSEKVEDTDKMKNETKTKKVVKTGNDKKADDDDRSSKSKKDEDAAVSKNDKKTKNTDKSDNNNQPETNSTNIELKMFNILTLEDIPLNARSIFDIGKGYTLETKIVITGGMLTELQKKRIENTVLNIHEKVREKMRHQIKEIIKEIISSNEGIEKLNDLVDDKDQELKEMVDESIINTEIENVVLTKLHSENKDLKSQPGWEVQSSVEYNPADLKISKSGITLYLTGGTDVSSYKLIASNIKNLDNILYDITTYENTLRKNLDKSVERFIKTSNEIIEKVDDVYRSNKIDENSTIKSILDTASISESPGQERFANYLRLKIIGSNAKTTEDEEKLTQYETYLSGTISKINDELTKLSTAEKSFKSSRINKSAKFWPELQRLKKHCYNVIQVLIKNQKYCERVKTKFLELDVTVGEETTLNKLKIIRVELNSEKIIESSSEGRIIVKKAASNVRSFYDAMNEICKIIDADETLQ